MSVYPIRRLRLQHAFNVRDLGGYETSGGSYTRWNVLYRADGLSGLDDKEWNILKEAGIRTVIDLRSKSEAQEQPEQVPEPIQYYHCPLQEEQISMGDIEASALAAFTQSLDEGYRMMVKNNGSLIAAALRTLIGGAFPGRRGIPLYCRERPYWYFSRSFIGMPGRFGRRHHCGLPNLLYTEPPGNQPHDGRNARYGAHVSHAEIRSGHNDRLTGIYPGTGSERLSSTQRAHRG